MKKCEILCLWIDSVVVWTLKFEIGISSVHSKIQKWINLKKLSKCVTWLVEIYTIVPKFTYIFPYKVFSWHEVEWKNTIVNISLLQSKLKVRLPQNKILWRKL